MGNARSAFGLTDVDFIRVPTLFSHRVRAGNAGTVAIAPDLVNGGAYGNTFITGMSFLHTEPGYPNEDTNHNFLVDGTETIRPDGWFNSTAGDPFDDYLSTLVSGCVGSA